MPDKSVIDDMPIDGIDVIFIYGTPVKSLEQDKFTRRYMGQPKINGQYRIYMSSLHRKFIGENYSLIPYSRMDPIKSTKLQIDLKRAASITYVGNSKDFKDMYSFVGETCDTDSDHIYDGINMNYKRLSDVIICNDEQEFKTREALRVIIGHNMAPLDCTAMRLLLSEMTFTGLHDLPFADMYARYASTRTSVAHAKLSIANTYDYYANNK